MELFERLATNSRITTEISISTIFANLLALATPLFVIQVLNRYVAFGVDATLVTLIIGVLIAIILEFCFRQLRSQMGANLSGPIDNRLSQKTFSILTHCKLAQIERLPLGLRQQVLQDVDVMKQAYNTGNIGSLFDLPFTLLFLLVMAVISFPLFIIGIIGAAILLALGLLNLFATRKSLPPVIQTGVSKSNLSNSIINHPGLIRAFNAAPFVGKLWKEILLKLYVLGRHMEGKQHLMQTLTQTITTIVTVLVIALGAKLVVTGYLNVGALIGVNILAARALAPIARFNGITSLLVQAEQSKKRLNNFAKIPLELQKGTALKEFSGRISFKDFAFAFPGNNTPLFESLDLEITPASSIGIIGPNSSGKTTLTRLLVDLYEPTRGQILIDGVDLKQIVSEWWRKQVCYLPQEPSFVEGTIRDNIIMANQELDNAKLNEIIHLADLRDYLDKSTNGLDEVLRENAKELAVGIRRRITLARALATDGKLVIFDEPTEALDPEGTTAVYKIIDKLIELKKTIVIASYDEKILEKMDIILDLGQKPTPKVSKKRA